MRQSSPGGRHDAAALIAAVRSGSRGGEARCPAHSDRDPSLSVSPGRDGRVLVKCHRDCTTESVVAALGMTMGDLAAAGAGDDWTPAGPAVATYEYVDEDGATLFGVARTADKAFRQWRPDPAKKSGRTWSLNGTRRVPYRLPKVIAAARAGATVHVVEGEKDVHAIERAGGTATCNPGGAGKWRPEYADYLAGAHVVVVADRDDPGRAHAADVAATLQGVAASIRVVEAAEGKDAADHLGAGLGLDELVPVEAVQVTGSGDLDTAEVGAPVDWATFWQVDRTAEDWLAEPVLPRGRAVATFSPGGVGKSLFAVDVSARLSTGRRVLDQPAGPPINVVYLDLEMTEDDLAERLTEMGYGPDTDLSHLHYYLLPTLAPLDTADGGRQLREIAALHDADLVVIDTTSRVISGPENDADTLRAFYRHTGSLLKADGRTVWRLDHAGKDLALGQRGTSAKNDDVDLVWQLTVRDDDAVRLRATKRRVSWAPEYVDLVRLQDPLRHERAVGTQPAGTHEAVELLDRLGVPVDHGRPRVRKVLHEHGEKLRDTVLSAAIVVRRERMDLSHGAPDSPVPSLREQVHGAPSGTGRGNRSSEPPLTSGNRSREQVGTGPPGRVGTGACVPKGTGPGPAPPSEPPDNDHDRAVETLIAAFGAAAVDDPDPRYASMDELARRRRGL